MTTKAEQKEIAKFYGHNSVDDLIRAEFKKYGNRSYLAKILGLSRAAIQFKLAKMGLNNKSNGTICVRMKFIKIERLSCLLCRQSRFYQGEYDNLVICMHITKLCMGFGSASKQNALICSDFKPYANRL